MTPQTSVAAGSDKLTREERRRRTELAILDAARELFAEVGFERTTIRAVAARAGIDPALVMQYYGNKEGLFAASARWSLDQKRFDDVTKEGLAQRALENLLNQFADSEQHEAALALMRNCLTHERARNVMRDEVVCNKQAELAGIIGGDDAELRAGLLAASMIGVTMARYLLGIPAVAAASPEDLERVLEPVLEALVNPAS